MLAVFLKTIGYPNPRPTKVIHDHGPEFEGHGFQFSLGYAGIKAANISPNTPTANSIIEATHTLIGQVIRTLINLKPQRTKSSCRTSRQQSHWDFRARAPLQPGIHSWQLFP